MKSRQIFILGAARSGTSIIRNLIADVLEIPSHGEGHILQLASRHLTLGFLYLESMKDLTDDVSVKQITAEDFLDLEASFVRSLYHLIFPDFNFLDKTPSSEVAHTWLLIKKAFPEAKIIFCVRNPVDVIDSALIKFKDNNINFEESCIDYDGCLGGLSELLNSEYSQDCFVIDHARTFGDREYLARDLLSFINENETLQSRIVDYLINNWTDNLTMNPNSPKTKKIMDVNWDNTKLKIFNQYCGKWLGVFNSGYFTNATRLN